MKNFIETVRHFQAVKSMELDLHTNCHKYDKQTIDNEIDKAHLKFEQLPPSLRNITHNDIELIKTDMI